TPMISVCRLNSSFSYSYSIRNRSCWCWRAEIGLFELLFIMGAKVTNLLSVEKIYFILLNITRTLFVNLIDRLKMRSDMVYDMTMLEAFYKAYKGKVESVRGILKRPLT